MNEDSEPAVECFWEEVDNYHWRATIAEVEGDREIVRDYYRCRYVVVEVEVLWEGGYPVAVSRQMLESDLVSVDGSVSDEEIRGLRTFAFESADEQMSWDFDKTVDFFEGE